MRPREEREQGLRQVEKAQEEDAPHAAQCVHVVTGAMRHRGAPKGLGHVGEAVRREAWQGDAGEGERVDPGVRHVGPAGHALDEGAVEGGVVREDWCAARELGERRNGLARGGGVGDVGVADARELLDLRGDGTLGMHEGLEALHDLAAAEARG